MKLSRISLLGLLVACTDSTEKNEAAKATTASADGAMAMLPAAPVAGNCPADGRLALSFYGALEGSLDWQGGELTCEGMPRPAGEGARLRFSGNAGDDGQQLAIILAWPGLGRGDTGKELSSNITVIEEGKGRFFSTPDLEHCWTDIARHEAVTDEKYRLDGQVYCIAPLGEVNGESSLSIESLDFSGFIDWTAN